VKRVAVIVFLLLPLVVFGVWIVLRARRPRPVPPSPPCTVASRRPPRLPSPASCGAVGRSEVEHFNRATIYTWVDGGAEPYLRNGFARSSLATYHFSAAGGREVTIEAAAIRFTSPRGARAQAAAETPAGAAPAPGLPGAVIGDDTLIVIRRCDMLRLVSFTPGVDATPQLTALARAWLAEHER